MGIFMFCAVFFVKTVTKYIEKKNVKSSYVCLPEYVPPTPPGNANAMTPLLLLLCVTGDAAEEQVTVESEWDRLLVCPLLPLLPSCQEIYGSLQANV